MRYDRVIEGTFLVRKNRFVAEVLAEGRRVLCHVKNTGRCRELLLPGATVYLEDHRERMGERKLAFSLVTVVKQREGGERVLINLDSQAPNRVVEEGLRQGSLLLPGFSPQGMQLLRERAWGHSRLDFCLEEGGRRAFLEVKGVTLESGGIALFPDAPTQRGIRHIKELIAIREAGIDAYILFVVQMSGMKEFRPNETTHPEFGEALRQGRAAGVLPLAWECRVEKDALHISGRLPVNIHKML